MQSRPKGIAIIQGHPDDRGGHFAHALAEAYAAGALESGHEVRTINVAKLEFPLIRRRADLERAAPPDAIRAAQAALLGADHIVLVHPIWNGGVPALLRGFLEQTFRPAFMFPQARPGERLGFVSALRQRRALAGKSGRIIATMQMPAFVYRWYFHPHPERNTFRLAGIRPVTESLIGLVESPNQENRTRWLDKIHELGRRAA